VWTVSTCCEQILVEKSDCILYAMNFLLQRIGSAVETITLRELAALKIETVTGLTSVSFLNYSLLSHSHCRVSALMLCTVHIMLQWMLLRD